MSGRVDEGARKKEEAEAKGRIERGQGRRGTAGRPEGAPGRPEGPERPQGDPRETAKWRTRRKRKTHKY
jgi:hypothetical protein